MIGDWNGTKLTHLKWSNEHDLPFLDDPYGGEPLENYHISKVTRMKA